MNILSYKDLLLNGIKMSLSFFFFFFSFSQNEYMKDDFFIKIETWHKPDLGTTDNVSLRFSECVSLITDKVFNTHKFCIVGIKRY